MNPNNSLSKSAQSVQNVYLKIDDAFIHELHPLIGNIGTFIMPDHQIGAHISIMYPEESIHVSSYDLNKTHDFVINAIADAILEDKRYIVLIVSSSSLSNLRTRYFLDERPCYKGVSVEFHITIATCYIGSPEVVRDR